MPIKLTKTEIRPDTSVPFYEAALIGETGNGLKDNPAVIDFNETVSQDGLTRVRTFILPDNFNLDDPSKEAYNAKGKQFYNQNNIVSNYKVENI
jgi:hypothetical protein